MIIKQAESDSEIAQARLLFEEYAAWLDVDLCFQNFEKELLELPGGYVPPDGRLLLASEGETLAGCIAMRRFNVDSCEMKRLFVRPEFRGQGLGRQLALRIIDEARTGEYRRMLLDTLPSVMSRAVEMYRALGFVEIDPYYPNPHEATLYMELEL